MLTQEPDILGEHIIQSTKMRFNMNLPSPLLSPLVILVILANLSFAVEGKAVNYYHPCLGVFYTEGKRF